MNRKNYYAKRRVYRIFRASHYQGDEVPEFCEPGFMERLEPVVPFTGYIRLADQLRGLRGISSRKDVVWATMSSYMKHRLRYFNRS